MLSPLTMQSQIPQIILLNIFRFDVDSVSLKGISDWLWTSYRDKNFKNQHLNVAEMNSFEVNVSLQN